MSGRERISSAGGRILLEFGGKAGYVGDGGAGGTAARTGSVIGAHVGSGRFRLVNRGHRVCGHARLRSKCSGQGAGSLVRGGLGGRLAVVRAARGFERISRSVGEPGPAVCEGWWAPEYRCAPWPARRMGRAAVGGYAWCRCSRGFRGVRASEMDVGQRSTAAQPTRLRCSSTTAAWLPVTRNRHNRRSRRQTQGPRPTASPVTAAIPGSGATPSAKRMARGGVARASVFAVTISTRVCRGTRKRRVGPVFLKLHAGAPQPRSNTMPQMTSSVNTYPIPRGERWCTSMTSALRDLRPIPLAHNTASVVAMLRTSPV